MTKVKIAADKTEMNMSSSGHMIEDWKDSAIAPCQEKVKEIINCCNDVVKKLEFFQSHLLHDDIQQTPLVKPENELRSTEAFLLQEKLRLSVLRINELELVEKTMREKIEDMEEKVQTLTAQLLVYKEDFDLERKDREIAQGRIAELEQLLMNQKYCKHDSSWSVVAPNSHRNLPRYHHNFSSELVARGEDVCDVYVTDGILETDKQYTSEIPADNESFYQQSPYSNVDNSSMQLVARSFNIQDLIPTFGSSKDKPGKSESHQNIGGKITGSSNKKSTDIHRKMGTKIAAGNKKPTVMYDLCADGPEEPVTKNPKFFSETELIDISVHKRKLSSATYPIDEILKNNTALHTWYVLSNEELNHNESPSPDSVLQSGRETSGLNCPKCLKSFPLADHGVFLDHLEEC